MVQRTVIVTYCDLKDCSAPADHFHLASGDRCWSLDLCPEHREFLLALPWRDELPPTATRPQRAAERRKRSLERRIRIGTPDEVIPT